MPPQARYDSQALAKGYQIVALELGCNAWDYLIGIDTEKSYRAFSMYRDLGYGRTFEKVARAFSQKVDSYIQQINAWSIKSFWRDRIREYDNYIEKIKRKESESLEISSHIDKLQRYRKESEILGWDNLAIASKCLSIAKKVLDNY